MNIPLKRFIDDMNKHKSTQQQSYDRSRSDSNILRLSQVESSQLKKKTKNKKCVVLVYTFQDDDFVVAEKQEIPRLMNPSNKIKFKPKENRLLRAQSPKRQDENYFRGKMLAKANEILFGAAPKRVYMKSPQKPKPESKGMTIMKKYMKIEDIIQLKQQYDKLKIQLTTPKVKEQIALDVKRTFPFRINFFLKENYDLLERVLNAISISMQTIGYVQGMNYIVGQLIFLSESDWVVFILYQILYQRLGLHRIYDHDMSGQQDQCLILSNLIEKYMPDLYEYFDTIDVRVEYFYPQWLYTLLALIVPDEKKVKGSILTYLKKKIMYLEMLFNKGTEFLIFISLGYIKYLEDSLLQCQMSDCLVMLTQKECLKVKEFDQILKLAEQYQN